MEESAEGKDSITEPHEDLDEDSDDEIVCEILILNQYSFLIDDK